MSEALSTSQHLNNIQHSDRQIKCTDNHFGNNTVIFK